MALLAASALLACLGITLLTHGPSPTPSSAPAATAAPTRVESSTEPSDSAPSRPAATPSASISPSPTPASADAPSATPVPEDVATVARRFVLAWTGHDARPGKDGSYDDAARRAGAYVGKDLAEQLTTTSAGSARQWQQWTQAQALVAAEISQLAVPDGAPAPTADTAWVRVWYRLTVTPAAGKPSGTDEQVALKLQRSQAGTWLVTALPDA
ncbi:hypothetical protein [Streptomyces sp. bgisy154]|uniref:hypothetical protein n=1 Tax=Streptomyces sp. bgisy154 TaxID=3413794 RepID=UPI003D744DB0